MSDPRASLPSGERSLWGFSLLVSLAVNGTIFSLIAWARTLSGTTMVPAQGDPPAPAERIATIELSMPPPQAAPAVDRENTPAEAQPEVAAASLPTAVSTRFARTSEDQASPEPPSSTVFIGERNTRAASDLEPEPNAPARPNQSGTASNFGEVDSLKAGGSQPAAGETHADSPQSSSSSSASFAGSHPVDVPVHAPAQPATPAPAVPLPEGESATARKTALRGSVARAEHSALDVVDSPMGRYQGAVLKAVEEEWLKNGERYQKFVTAGFMTVRFVLAPDGKVRSLSVVEAVECSDPQKGYTLGSIRSAKLPPMPRELKKQLGNGPLELSVTFSFPSS